MLFIVQVKEIDRNDPLLLPTVLEYPCNLYKAMLSFLEHWTGVPEHLAKWAEFCASFEQGWYQCRSLMHEKLTIAGLEISVSAVEAPTDWEPDAAADRDKCVDDATYPLTMCYKM